MERKVRSRLLLGCTGAALALGLTATALSGSAALDSGAFFVKSVDDGDAAITGLAGMNGTVDAGNPGGGDGGGTPTTPGPSNPTPVGSNVPAMSIYSKFYARDANSVWNQQSVVNSEGTLSTQDNAVPGLRDTNGNLRDAIIGLYDGNGHPVAVATWWDSSNNLVDGIWRNSGSGYQLLGQTTRTNGGNTSVISTPQGWIFAVTTNSSEIKIQRSNGFRLEQFLTIPLDRALDRVTDVAVSEDGEVGVIVDGQAKIYISPTDTSGTVDNARSISATPGGAFVVGTDSGIKKVAWDGRVIFDAKLDGPVSMLSVGANGRVAYLVGDLGDYGKPAEIRTLDPSGKQLVWIKNIPNIS